MVQAAVDRPGREQTVCLFPHPDDEFAIFAEIEARLREGHRVVCVYLTDGAYGGQSADRRIAESRGVLRKLGVAAEDIHVPGLELGIGDTLLFRRMSEAMEATRRVIAHRGGPLWILMPAWEGGHHDHDAAHLIGLRLAHERRATANALQFSLYQGAGLPGSLFRVLSPLSENGPVLHRKVAWIDRLRYLGYCLSYPSQWKTWLGLWPLVCAHYLTSGTQQLQHVDPARVQKRPHSGALLYERRGFCTWEAFARTTADIRAELAAAGTS